MELAHTEVLVVDCQATAARLARGFVMEIAWARSRADTEATGLDDVVSCRQVVPPPGATVPSAVTRITGLTEHDLANGAPIALVWNEVLDAARELARMRVDARAPTVVHFARFEEGLFRDLHATHGASTPFPFDWVCTHEIARRLLPGLPRRGLRALTGYFGRSVCPLRRSRDHVEATAFVWREVVEALEPHGVTTWPALREWLGRPAARSARRVYPMPRELRLSLPNAPGVYRLLRRSGDVIYVGKATSLRKRVNQHFTKQAGLHERALELLAQVRDVSFVATETALEAALLESDEIKRCRPAYNVALLEVDRAVWSATEALTQVSRRVGEAQVVGPFGSAEIPFALGSLAAMIDAPVEARINAVDQARALMVPARRAPDDDCFRAGLVAFRDAHREPLARARTALARLRAIGAIAWRRQLEDGAAADDDAAEASADRAPRWDPETVRVTLDDVVVGGARAMRRARWLVALSQSSVVWRERMLDSSMRRSIVLVDGDVVSRGFLREGEPAPIPPGLDRSHRDRLACFDVARLDRLRILTTELRRLLAHGDAESAEIRLGPRRVLRGQTLLRALRWV